MTNRQQLIYDFIVEFDITNGYTPMMKDIQRHFGFSSKATVAGYLERLELQGKIQREYKKCRGITLLT